MVPWQWSSRRSTSMYAAGLELPPASSPHTSLRHSPFRVRFAMSLCTASRTFKAFEVPLFLAPAFSQCTARSHVNRSRPFSTSPLSASRRLSGPNKQRGVSAIRSKNPKQKTEVYRYPLPVPVIKPERRAAFKTRPDHGLWGFFDKEQRTLLTPSQETAHGRAWAVSELAIKSFGDLHRLFWACVLEQNRIATRKGELHRTRAGYGEAEMTGRLEVVSHLLRPHFAWSIP
jgi:large subunit ribosomal protein L47